MKIRRKGISLFLAGVLLGMLFFPYIGSQQVQAATIEKVKIGYALSVARNGAVYASNNEEVAHVTPEGKVIGKKKGTAVISVSKGKSTENITVNVVANAKKPSINVCTDEIVITKHQISFTEIKENEWDRAEAVADDQTDSHSYLYELTYTIKNTASKTASRVVITGKIGQKEISFTAKKLAAGKEKEFVYKGIADNNKESFELTKIQVYSHGMIHTYSYAKDKYSLAYATADTEAPVISGFVEKDSYNGEIPYQILYSDDARNYDFFKYVSAEDNRDTKVDLKVDTSKVDFSKTGTYKIKYIATDSSGNKETATAKIGVRVETNLDRMCDNILKSIIKSSWSDTKKAQAIYKYTRGHIAYTGSSDKSSWERAAENGIRYGRGDCFTYYAVARALLTRAGIVNIEVRRVQGHGNHWWNMVYVQGAFYHFDTCPRRVGGNFCLVTDAQLKNYSSSHGNSHIWDYKKIPKSGTKVISSIY